MCKLIFLTNLRELCRKPVFYKMHCSTAFVPEPMETMRSFVDVGRYIFSEIPLGTLQNGNRISIARSIYLWTSLEVASIQDLLIIQKPIVN